MKRIIEVSAPSNIALVKYMGKTNSSLNLPANPSLSMTLSTLSTFTQVEFVSKGKFRLDWQGLSSYGQVSLRPFSLREHERLKVERHFRRIFDYFGQPTGGSWVVRSGNSFPAGAGIASSASGFAALTLGIVSALGLKNVSRSTLSELSRQGSGSSCRSFGGPWVLWEGEYARRVESNFEPLSDLVLLVEESEKKVGSSDAHQRVLSSKNWEGRVERATARVSQLQDILLRPDWQRFSSLAWQEALDMHALFHQAEPSFSYFQERTREILNWFESLGSVRAAITLDAGPNIHLLVPQSDEAIWKDRVLTKFPKTEFLVDRQGLGAMILSEREEAR